MAQNQIKNRVSDEIVIEYDGSYPALCSGNLVVIIKGKRWEFPPNCLSSGGGTNYSADLCWWSGGWSIEEWPDGFPEELKDKVAAAINNQIPWGCCGGCI